MKYTNKLTIEQPVCLLKTFVASEKTIRIVIYELKRFPSYTSSYTNTLWYQLGYEIFVTALFLESKDLLSILTAMPIPSRI